MADTVTIRELLVKIGVDGNSARGAAAEITAISTAVSGLKAGLDLLAATARRVFDATFGALLEFNDRGGALKDMSAQVGVAASTLTEFEFVARQSGSTLDDFAKSLILLGRNLRAGALAGDDAPINQTLRALHLNISDLLRLDAVDQFEAISDAFAELPAGGNRAALAMELFGRSGAAMLPVLERGSAGIQAMRNDARDMGIALTDDMIDRADEASDAWDRMKDTLIGLRNSVLSLLSGDIRDIANAVAEWVKNNRELIAADFKTFFQDMREAAPAVGEDVIALTKVMGGLAKGVLAVVGAFSRMSGALGEFRDKVDELDSVPGNIVRNAGNAKGLNARDARETRYLRRLEQIQKDSRANFAIERSASFEDEDVASFAPIIDASNDASFEAFDPANSSLSTFARPKSQSATEALRDLIMSSPLAGLRSFSDQDQLILKLDKLTRREREAIFREVKASRPDTERAIEGLKKELAGDKKEGRKATQAELLALINTAARSGRSLDDLASQRKLTAGTPPVVAVTLHTYNVTQNVDSPIVVKAGPGMDGPALAQRVHERFTKERDADLTDLIRRTASRVAR